MISFVFLTVNLTPVNVFVFQNQRHPKIKFTTEKETENQLSFLYLLITSKGDNFKKSTAFTYTLAIYVLLLSHIKLV